MKLLIKSFHNASDKIPYRYGLDAIPGDINKQELLSFFSLSDNEQVFIKQKCRLSPSRIVLAIQLGAYKFIGRPQQQPEQTPPTVINFLANTLGLGGEFVPLEYSDQYKTRLNHDYRARQFLGL